MTDAGKKTLILITTSFPISGDGSEAAGSFVADLAKELSAHAKIKVVAPGTEECIESLHDGLEVFRFKAGKKALSQLSLYNPFHLILIVRALLSLKNMSLTAAHSGRIDHVFALWVLPSGWAARCIKKNHGIPYSVWALGSDIWSLGKIPIIKEVLKRISEDAEHRFADGLQLAEDAETFTGCDYSFQPSTRDFSPESPKQLKAAPPYKLLFLGRWHVNKGVDILLDALELLSDDDWSLIDQVLIAGGGPLSDIVVQKAGALQRNGRNVVVGSYLDKSAAALAFNVSDYLLLPSRIESIPVVFSDAMKFRCPVVACPVGDLFSLITRYHSGLIASDCEASSFAAAMKLALRHSPKDFASGLSETSKLFDLKNIASNFIASADA